MRAWFCLRIYFHLDFLRNFKMTTNNKKVFIKVTNQDIYSEILALREDFNKIKSKVKVNTWIASTALSLTVGALLGFILSQ